MESIAVCPHCQGRGTCCCDDKAPTASAGKGAKAGVRKGRGQSAGTTSRRGYKPTPGANSKTSLPFSRASQPSPTVPAASALPYVFDDWALSSAIAVYAAFGNVDITIIQTVW